MKRKTKGMLAAAAALMCIFVASGCGKSGGGSDAANPASSGSGETAAQNLGQKPSKSISLWMGVE